MKSSTIRHSARALAALPLLAASIAPAFAHHMEGGQMPSTFTAGLLSGIGHPIIGLDHFAFIAGVAFVAATIVGCALHLQGVTLPAAEIVVAASVLIVGAAIMTGRAMPAILAASIFALAGLFHGYAYGEAIFGAEQTPVVASLIGFAAIQTAIAVVVMLITGSLASMASAVPARLAGAVIAGIGLTFLVQNVESVIIPAPAPIMAPSA
jgi:urease accessory protein